MSDSIVKEVEILDFDADFDSDDRRDNLAKYGLVGGAAVGGALIATSPAEAQTASPADQVETMVTGLAGITATAVTVVLGVMAAYFAFRIVKRVMQ